MIIEYICYSSNNSIFGGRCSEFKRVWQELILKYCVWDIRDSYGYFK